jgi:CubicO group peptidase (beta-lactamase class C family)/pimeloyl-ACP methyl ester carboxylesterase
MNGRETLIVLSAVCLVANTGWGQRQDKHVSDPFEGLDSFVERSRAETEVPGVAVAVVHDGEVLYVKGFGQRDVENGLPVTPDTLFPIGSCGKAFTALAVGMLVDAGTLDLDTPVVEYLPDFRLYDDHATLHATARDLLCHRTGVPAYDMLWLTVPLSRDEYYRRLRHLQPSTGFRETFQYSNLMYMAAGVLVGRLSGGTWEEYISKRIFDPLKMSRSNLSVTDSQCADDFSFPYASIDGKPMKIPFRNLDPLGPAGSINSSASEMAKWLMLQLGGGAVADRRLVSEHGLAETHRPHMAISDPVMTRVLQASVYGQGWFISQYRGHRLVEHQGGIDGFAALVSLLPEERIGVVVLTNTQVNMLTYLVSRNISDRLLGLEIVDRDQEYAELLAYVKQAWGSPAQTPSPLPGTSPSRSLSVYAGIYEHPAFGPIKVTLDQDHLSVDHLGTNLALEHFHYDVFQLQGRALPGEKLSGQQSALAGRHIQFHSDLAGSIDHLSVRLEPAVPPIAFPREHSETHRDASARESAAASRGVNSLEEVTLGGTQQWILIRGDSTANPILLFLHGGPGFAEMPYAHLYTTILTKHFIVVDWDQRGAGKSYTVDMPEATMHLEQFLSDTHELIQLLKQRFSKDKIFLIGHSWGSILGLHTAHKHPEDLHAYIGMGQIVSSREGENISYRYTLEKARNAKDEQAVEMLKIIGPPPYEAGLQSLFTQRMLLVRYGGSVRNISYQDLERLRNGSPYYTEQDNSTYMQAFAQTFPLLYDELMRVNFFKDVPELQVPVYFFTGRHDFQTPFELVERYVDVLRAPHKEIVWFENSGHIPNLDEPEAYQGRLVNLVLKKTFGSDGGMTATKVEHKPASEDPR